MLLITDLQTLNKVQQMTDEKIFNTELCETCGWAENCKDCLNQQSKNKKSDNSSSSNQSNKGNEEQANESLSGEDEEDNI